VRKMLIGWTEFSTSYSQPSGRIPDNRHVFVLQENIKDLRLDYLVQKKLLVNNRYCKIAARALILGS
jgi:hypothetical protein